MSTELHDAVLAHVAALDPVAPWYWFTCRSYDAPVFRRHDDGTVSHVSGRPPVTLVRVEVLKTAADEGITWNGTTLVFPGDLRYRPIDLDPAGQLVLCELVTDTGPAGRELATAVPG
jgi:hypothetical protein